MEAALWGCFCTVAFFSGNPLDIVVLLGGGAPLSASLTANEKVHGFTTIVITG